MGLNSHLYTNHQVPLYRVVPLSLSLSRGCARKSTSPLYFTNPKVHLQHHNYHYQQDTNTTCGCATLHIAGLLASLSFPPTDENLHDIVSSWLLCWPGKESLRSHFNCLFCLGVKEVGDIVEAQSQRMLGFVEARHLLCIPPNYGFIWQQLQNI